MTTVTSYLSIIFFFVSPIFHSNSPPKLQFTMFGRGVWHYSKFNLLSNSKGSNTDFLQEYHKLHTVLLDHCTDCICQVDKKRRHRPYRL